MNNYTRLISNIIEKRDIPFELLKNLDQKKYIKIASHNRILYLSAKNLLNFKGVASFPELEKKLKDIINKGDRYLDKLKQTLIFVLETLSKAKVQFLITKSHRYIPYVTYDVDVFVRPDEYPRAIEIFRMAGLTISSHDHSFGGRNPGCQVNIRREDLLQIDLHRDFTWMKSTYLDLELLWQGQQKQEVAGVVCPVPSLEVDFILNAVHILYERFYVTLLDFYSLQELKKQGVNMKLMLMQAKKHGWDEAFLKLEKLFANIKTNASFPIFLPKTFILDIFIEKLKKRKSFDYIAFAYCCYTLSKYYLSRKRRIPYYDHWYDFSNFEV